MIAREPRVGQPDDWKPRPPARTKVGATIIVEWTLQDVHGFPERTSDRKH